MSENLTEGAIEAAGEFVDLAVTDPVAAAVVAVVVPVGIAGTLWRGLFG